MTGFEFRPMFVADVGQVPMDCHGGDAVAAARIGEIGSAAMLAFEGGRHVAQLQFRRHDPALRSPSGIWSPDYWGDFGETQPTLPEGSLGLFCYHVGQLGPGEARDRAYQGRGLGVALLERTIDWAASHGFEAIIAKFTPPDREVMAFMGGQPASVYIARGFDQVASWQDEQLLAALQERGVVDRSADPARVAQVGMCVRRLSRDDGRLAAD